MEFLAWLHALPLSELIATSDWGYPLLLSAHSIGMGVVVGLLVMLDVRVLGYRKDVPISAFQGLMRLAWIGFGINAVSGVLLFMSDAERLILNWPFQLKMACVFLGGGLAWALWRALRAPDAAAAAEGGAIALRTPTPRAKALAVLSILVWLVAIIGGRLIAYVLDHSMLRAG